MEKIFPFVSELIAFGNKLRRASVADRTSQEFFTQAIQMFKKLMDEENFEELDLWLLGQKRQFPERVRKWKEFPTDFAKLIVIRTRDDLANIFGAVKFIGSKKVKIKTESGEEKEFPLEKCSKSFWELKSALREITDQFDAMARDFSGDTAWCTPLARPPAFLAGLALPLYDCWWLAPARPPQ